MLGMDTVLKMGCLRWSSQKSLWDEGKWYSKSSGETSKEVQDKEGGRNLNKWEFSGKIHRTLKVRKTSELLILSQDCWAFTLPSWESSVKDSPRLGEGQYKLSGIAMLHGSAEHSSISWDTLQRKARVPILRGNRTWYLETFAHNGKTRSEVGLLGAVMFWATKIMTGSHLADCKNSSSFLSLSHKKTWSKALISQVEDGKAPPWSARQKNPEVPKVWDLLNEEAGSTYSECTN